MTTNAPNHDLALSLAKTVGTNFRTLRDNKRKLAFNLVLAVAVEGFGWTDEWAAVKKQMKFANLEKPEQNQVNVFGTMCKTIILAWPSLATQTTVIDGKDVSVTEAFKGGHILPSTLAASIKDAEKARDKADADDNAKQEASEDASKQATADIEGAPKPDAVNDRSAMIEMVAAMFDTDADAKAFTQAEIDAMLALIGKVDAFKAATIAQAKAA